MFWNLVTKILFGILEELVVALLVKLALTVITGSNRSAQYISVA